MVEFIFLGYSGIAMCVDKVYESSDFLSCLVVAVVIQDLVSVRVLLVYLCLDRPVLGCG